MALNFIQWGMGWHNALRNQNTTSLATITHQGGTLEVPATKTSPGSYVNAEGVRVVSQHSLMMFNRSDVVGVRWTPGVQIEKDDINYEVLIDRIRQEEFDDPVRLTINIPVREC